MLNALIRKQLLELIAFIFYDAKKGKRRSLINLIVMGFVFTYIFGAILFMFFGVASQYGMLIELGMDWFYFDMMALLAIVFAVMGSAFSTYSSVYLSKDNELLLSLPISQSSIIISRLISVYLIDFLLTCFVFIPTIIIYFLMTDFSLSSLICQLIMIIVISFIVFALSTILGLAIALISVHLKNSFVIVGLSLIFLGLYFCAYTQILSNLSAVLNATLAMGALFENNESLIYYFGQAFVGNHIAIMISLFVSILLVALVFAVLDKSFIKIVTMNKGEKRTTYNEKSIQKSSLSKTLFKKEFIRYLSSANYMLNCSLGTVLMPVGGIIVLFKSDSLNQMTQQMNIPSGTVFLLTMFSICMAASMNNISTPSISLEGKSLWIYQTLPVNGWDILKAKCKVHLVMTLPASTFMSICFGIAFGLDWSFIIILLVVTSLFVLFEALAGLMLGLLMPNLDWKNEIVVLKQSVSAMISIFGVWVFLFAFAALYYVLRNTISAMVFISFVSILFIVLNSLIYVWLRNKGSKIFMSL